MYLDRISVVVTTRNRKYEVVRALKSVYAQELAPYEVIIVDDGSTDGTREYVAANILGEYKYIYLPEDDEHSVGNARNVGIAEASGDWIAFLDSDDVWYPNWLKEASTFVNEGRSSFSFGYNNNCNLSVVVADYIRRYNDRNIESKQKHERREGYLLNGNAAASFFIVRKDFFTTVGLFSTDQRGMTDWEWLHRADDIIGHVDSIKKNAGEQWVLYDSYMGRYQEALNDYIEMNKVLGCKEMDDLLFFINGLIKHFEYDISREELIRIAKERMNLGELNELVRALDVNQFGLENANLKNSLDKQKSFYQVMSEWVKLKTNGERIGEKLLYHDIKMVAIYGAGKHGIMLAKDLINDGIEVTCFIDKNAKLEEIDGIKVIVPEKMNNCVDAVIVSVYHSFDSISDELSKYVDTKFISMDRLICGNDFMPASLVEQILLESDSEDYSSYVYKYSDDTDVFKNLSDAASTIMRWYPFKKECSILQLNAGLGATTGALCDAGSRVVSIVKNEKQASLIRHRYCRRDNLAIFTKHGFANAEIEKFDYIIVSDGLEHAGNGSSDMNPYVDYLRRLSDYLTEDGIIILLAENTYSIRNLCGRKDPFTNVPFDGISGYKNGTNARGFSRNKLQRIVEMAGFNHNRFYYPVYDSVVPRVLYTDKHLPDNRIFERYENYYLDSNSLVADDRQMLVDVIENGTFPFHANCFVVEMSKSDNLCGINYATISSNRCRENAFAVCIYDGGRVQKKCMFSETENYAKELCEDTTSLGLMGVPVLEMRYDNHSLEMKYINSISLQEWIGQLVRQGSSKDDIISLFDRLWDYVLLSSKVSEKCAIDTKGINPGVVLEKAHIEMIPLNCFYDNGDFLFFDQEFCFDNYPANYVMARAIRNAIIFIDGFMDVIPEDEIGQRYGISPELKEIYYEIDANWVKEINEPLQIMYRHKADWSVIRNNQIKLTR